MPAHIEYIDMPSDLLGKYQSYTCAEMQKARAVLKDAAVCAPLEGTVVEYVKEYLVPDKRW
jgi:ADP-L-glycero-D-manno-heptose 6-epimerase